MHEPSELSSQARSKLQLSLAAKDGCSLHRWVLLKNSILRSQPVIAAAAPTLNQPDAHFVHSPSGCESYDEEYEEEESDSFLFPDAGKLLDRPEKDSASEAQWLDSLLETLVDEEDDLNVDAQISTLSLDDEEDLSSPLISPMSSSDDLTQPVYFPLPIAVPYPIPYSPLLHAYAEPESSLDLNMKPISPPPLDPPVFPYYDIDDLEDLSVPEAIEDTSDDDSDAPSTPLRNSTSTISLVDPASIPLPPERRRRPQPRVYLGTDNSYLYPFELDPLPFAEDHITTYPDFCQEC
jgi:hypothetical protein